VDDQRAEASLVRERALLLEALTLLVQRQAESDAALSDELARANTRVAAIERRSIELENRLVLLDERLSQLATEVEPDPGLPRRLAVLQAHVERLGGQPTAEPPYSPPAAPVPPVPARPMPASPAPPVAARPAQMPPADVRTSRPAVRPSEPAEVPARGTEAPHPQAATDRRQALVPSGEALWERLGATNQDRASIVLIGAGVLVVAYAVLAQLRIG
jgi:hypothetical protein